jgi:hypothetical protein
MTVERDAHVATKRGMTFCVCRKEGPKRSWQTVAAGLDNLRVAVDQARRLDAHEVAVFTDGPSPLDGFLYWTSAMPDVLNSTVVTHEVG